MKLVNIMGPCDVLPILRATDKEGAIAEICSYIARAHPEIRGLNACSVLLSREQLGSTGIGEGVAIPHGKLDTIEHLVACLARSLEGVPFNALDGERVKLFFVLLAPGGEAGLHLKALARVAKLMRGKLLRKQLMEAADADVMYGILINENIRYQNQE